MPGGSTKVRRGGFRPSVASPAGFLPAEDADEVQRSPIVMRPAIGLRSPLRIGVGQLRQPARRPMGRHAGGGVAGGWPGRRARMGPASCRPSGPAPPPCLLGGARGAGNNVVGPLRGPLLVGGGRRRKGKGAPRGGPRRGGWSSGPLGRAGALPSWPEAAGLLPAASVGQPRSRVHRIRCSRRGPGRSAPAGRGRSQRRAARSAAERKARRRNTRLISSKARFRPSRRPAR